jgi:predicted DNA-binding transcriptional regulator AlpA
MAKQAEVAEKALALKNKNATNILGFLPRSASNVIDDRDVLLTRPEAAQYLRKTVPTLERWSRDGVGPRPIKMGPRSVFYRLCDLRAFAAGGGEAA